VHESRLLLTAVSSVLATTLSSLQTLLVSDLVLLIGVDWFMATCRALTNMIGNSVACVVVSQWVKSVDRQRMYGILDGKIFVADADVLTTAA
jgi:aerobic C4-dicarboxylate transport protein